MHWPPSSASATTTASAPWPKTADYPTTSPKRPARPARRRWCRRRVRHHVGHLGGTGGAKLPGDGRLGTLTRQDVAGQETRWGPVWTSCARRLAVLHSTEPLLTL